MRNIIFLLLLFFVSTTILTAQNNFVGNQVIVMLNGAGSIEQIIEETNANYSSNIFVNRILSRRANIYLLEFDSNLRTVAEVIRMLKNDERITFSQPNHTNIVLRNTTPNDLEYPVQWSLGNSATARIYAPEAWDISTDEVTSTNDTIVFAIVDEGVDIQHIDLNMFKNQHEIPNNGIDDDQNGYIDDYDGWNAYTQNGVITSASHGTHVAGITGAKSNNSEGIAGIVWGAKLMPINASSGIESVVLEGYGYVLEMREKYNESKGDSGAFVVAANSSFGIDFGQPADFPIWCAFYDSLGAAGVLSVAATSNAGLDVDVLGDMPTTCPSNYMIAVSNINNNGVIYGGYGATQIDLAAPGVDIRSTIPGHNYGNKTGTSMAAPHVTGAIGSIYSAMCLNTMQDVHNEPEVMALLVANTLLESVDTAMNLQGKNNTGGRLNLFNALQELTDYSCNYYYVKTVDDICGTCNGQVFITINGENGPYSIQFSISSKAQGDTLISGLCKGEYFLEITDKDGLITKETIEITGNAPMIVSSNIIAASNSTTTDGSIALITSGGIPDYNYNWSNGSTSPALSAIGKGNYSVTITDKEGCEKKEQYYVHSLSVDELNQVNFGIYPNPNDGNFTIKFNRSLQPSELIIYDSIGKTVYREEFTTSNNEFVLNTSLSKGIYFVRIGTLTKQIMIY